eukprot:4173597-Lingulodinium_polyedra.AAC.1
MDARPIINSLARALMVSSAVHGLEMSFRAACALSRMMAITLGAKRVVFGDGLHEASGLGLTAGRVNAHSFNAVAK